MDLKIATFNCFSIRKRIDIVRELFSTNDIVMLQEILLSADDLNIAQKLNPNFLSCHVPSYDPSVLGLNGRLSGGLSIFWNNSLNSFIKPINCSDNILGVRFSYNNISILIINIYLPCDDKTTDSLLKYRHILLN